MNKWGELTKREQNKIAYEWAQCEGYTDEGVETSSPEDYYYATQPNLQRTLTGDAPYQKGDIGPSASPETP